MFNISVNRPLTWIFVFVTIIINNNLHGQDVSTFSQFPQNPFQFNPSYAAQNGQAEANIFYRKQWMGIENAPEVGAFNIQAPVGRNVSLGFTAVSNKTILLNTTSVLATFAYRVRMGYGHHLNFGLSGGLSLNKFDLAAVANINDPALANVIQNNQNVISQFGFNYQYKNLNIGFALPSILDSKPNSLKEFQEIKFDPFDNKFGSVSYDFHLRDFQISPIVIYRALDSQQDQWEGMLLATYRNFIWVGASYRDGYGLTGLIGVKLKGIFKGGYAYEHPTSDISKASGGSHEIYLGARLGSRDREEEYAVQQAEKDSLAQVATLNKPVEEPIVDDKKQPEIETAPETQTEAPVVTEVTTEEPTVAPMEENKPIENTPEQSPEEVVTEKVVESKPEEKEEVLLTSYYVVLGAYHSQDNAMKQMQILRNKGMTPEMMHIAEKNFYYVFTFKTDNREAALEEYRKEREKNDFPDVWIYRVTEEK